MAAMHFQRAFLDFCFHDCFSECIRLRASGVQAAFEQLPNAVCINAPDATFGMEATQDKRAAAEAFSPWQEDNVWQ